MNKSNVCSYIQNGINRPKKKFHSAEEAFSAAKKVNLHPTTIHKFWGYKCTVCHLFHIGRTTKINESTINIFSKVDEPKLPEATEVPDSTIVEPEEVQPMHDDFDWSMPERKMKKIDSYYDKILIN